MGVGTVADGLGGTLLDRTAYGVYRATLAGHFVYVNKALTQMLGYSSPGELMQVHIPTGVYMEPSERELMLRRLR
jgi:PAS domain-containing protein